METEKCQGDIYLGLAYDMQVWRNADKEMGSWGYILADPDKPETFSTFSYTMFMVDADNNITLGDKDVIVTTGHLAEIYRCVSDHMWSDEYDPRMHIRSDTGEEKD
jgi:hypothetical protein